MSTQCRHSSRGSRRPYLPRYQARQPQPCPRVVGLLRSRLRSVIRRRDPPGWVAATTSRSPCRARRRHRHVARSQNIPTSARTAKPPDHVRPCDRMVSALTRGPRCRPVGGLPGVPAARQAVQRHAGRRSRLAHCAGTLNGPARVALLPRALNCRGRRTTALPPRHRLHPRSRGCWVQVPQVPRNRLRRS